MRCYFCGHNETQVVETRLSEDLTSIRRRRRCTACDRRFTTYERAEVAMPIIVKRDGRRIAYSRQKLLDSMMLALRKRDVSMEKIDASVIIIEEKLLALAEREVSSTKLGEMVMRELKKLDKVAYIRFASVYRSFEDVEEFSAMAEQLRKK